MNEPRYTVGSVTGFRFMHKTNQIAHEISGRQRPIITWYVYDRPFGYRVVAAFDDRYQHHGPYWVRWVTKIPAEQMAKQKARKLERRHRRWLRRQGLL